VRIDRFVADRVAGSQIPALALGVSHNGLRSVVSGGRSPVAVSAPYRIASLTKPFTSAAVVLAFTAQDIPLSTPAIELLPALAPDWEADPAISVAQLLGQVAGLRAAVDGVDVSRMGNGPDAVSDAARLVVQAGSDRVPGERWSYYNGNYFLLGAVLSAVTGVSYEEAVTQTLLVPWELTHTGFAPPSAPVVGRDGLEPLEAETYARGRRPSGGLWSSVADLLTFAEHLLSDGELLKATRRRQTQADDPLVYGLGWALGPSGQMYLNGRLPGYRAAMLLVPDCRYASVALANQTQALPEIARLLNGLQHPLTLDHIADEILTFAA
jgi:D-alanyl-D-alanine carboxypeptidase